ncbi:bifunctional riboflavin kinase/FAD synthetase [Paenibacillus sp. GCM10027626]|uniref:bifunctional riboflavin kinase/FAD synthetase n=1 Tax=Paenibacillus sp. GCM10027626 TaxID=3273411 RepID=UPI0036418FB1
MEIIRLHYPLQGLDAETQRPKSVAIGYFDGVHRGHQNVIKQAVKAAHENGMEAAAMTFHPHPKEVLGKGDQYITCLSPLEEKMERFRALGVDIVYLVRFDKSFAAVNPESFVAEFLRPLHVKRIVVGFDFTFGARGAGTAETLVELAKPDMEVDIVEALVMKNGDKVSSTHIRAALSEGQPEVARELLGAPYTIAGTVVRGDGRGRSIGVPTANLGLSEAYVIPKLGVYAIETELASGECIPGILNVGVKPTFHDHLPEPVMEAHLFDFDRDIYGQILKVRLLTYIRAERRFGSVQELIQQIGKDIAEAKNALAAMK